MQNLTGRNNFFITASLWVYILAGTIASSLFMLDAYGLSKQASHTQASLYDIRPELTGTTDTTPEEAEEEEEDVHYYAFTTTNKITSLHVRKEPGMNGEIIYRLPPKSTGYVLELGESWSLIQTPEITGYSYNGYLDFQEVSEEEYLAW